jgi:hypothetical protein
VLPFFDPLGDALLRKRRAVVELEVGRRPNQNSQTEPALTSWLRQGYGSDGSCPV